MGTNGIKGIQSGGKRRLALQLGALFAAGLLSACVPPSSNKEKELEMSQAAVTVTGTPRLALATGSNKRYFVNASTGNPVYVAGTHTWNNFQDRSDHANMNYTAMLASMANNWNSSLGGLAKHRLIRLWTGEANINGNSVFTPNPFMKDGPGGQYNFGPTPSNCTLSNPDAPRFNQAYFDRLASRVSQAKAAGIYVSVMLFQAWSVFDWGGDGNPWPYHWFNPNNNCNGIDGNANSTYTAQGYRDGMAVQTRAPMKGGPAVPGRTTTDQNVIWRIQVAYMKKVVNTIHSVAAGGGDNVIYDVSNESGWFSSDWQDDMINEIKSYEGQTAAGACGGQNCKAHPVGKTYLTCTGNAPFPYNPSCHADMMLTNSPADWISLWQSAYYPDADNDPVIPPAHKVNISDSDHGYLAAFSYDKMWKHFMRGHNLWYMDTMDMLTETDYLWERRALGHTVAYADKVNLLLMTIQAKGTTTPASSGYSMSNAVNGEYMALRLGRPLTFTVPAGTYACEWFDIDNHVVQSCGMVSGTPSSQPFANAVLLLKSTDGGV